MSGSLRLVPPATPPQAHDHFDLLFADTVLRLRDPRRFGALLWHEGEGVETHPLLAGLGIEPLSADFDGDWLYAATRGRRAPIKPLLMDSRLVVGIGNIYAAESLHLAGIAPRRTANRISRARYRRAGGSRPLDPVGGDRRWRQQRARLRPQRWRCRLLPALLCAVYDRAGEPCPGCGGPVRMIRQGGRSSFYCPHCQR
jgi:formamidopyrimidine-DNA glycosylase